MLTYLLLKKQFFSVYLLYIYIIHKRESKYMLQTQTKPFGTMTRRASKRKSAAEFEYLKAKDRRMRFNNSQDPIYYIFDCIENRPVSVLAKEFVKDSFFEVANFVSKVIA